LYHRCWPQTHLLLLEAKATETTDEMGNQSSDSRFLPWPILEERRALLSKESGLVEKWPSVVGTSVIAKRLDDPDLAWMVQVIVKASTAVKASVNDGETANVGTKKVGSRR
jgi:hypothetical protein